MSAATLHDIRALARDLRAIEAEVRDEARALARNAAEEYWLALAMAARRLGARPVSTDDGAPMDSPGGHWLGHRP